MFSWRFLFCKKCIWEKTEKELNSNGHLYLNEVIYSNPELVNKIIQKRGKYKHHKFIRYNNDTKTFEFFCEKANVFFTTKTLQSEIGFTKTECEYCANTTKINKSRKLAKHNHERANLQLAKKAAARRKMLQWLFSFIACGIVIIFAALIVLNSLYLSWDYSDPEMAVAGVLYHATEI